MPAEGESMVLVRRSRTRAGCKTCRVRKVKCGEEKPFCLRCTSTGRKCDGYPQTTIEQTPSRSGHVTKRDVSPVGISMHQVLGDNIQYLEFYHHCAAPSMASKFDGEFWSRVPLRMAQSELSVRHALIALSYLNKTETGTLKDARSSLVVAGKEKTMLDHYNKAVKHLVKRMSEPSYSDELGLVCCILFVCLEFLRGNYDTAMEHYKSGAQIISTYKRKASTSLMNRSEDIIEDLLIPMFARNYATAIIFGVPSEHVYYTPHYPAGTHECVFNTVQEAELSAQNIRNMAFILTRALGTKTVMQQQHTREELQAQQDCLEHHRIWLRALEKLEREKTLSKEDSTAASFLKSIHHLMYVFTAQILLTAQTDWDQHLDDFKAVVYNSKAFLDGIENNSSRKPAANFTFDVGVIPGLYMTACRCRCPITRREALSLLERDLPREGLWDAQQHAMVARRIIEFEESEVDAMTGWPAERTRIWSTMIRGEMDESGKFPVDFAIGHWGEGRGTPPLPPGGVFPHDPNGRIWREWFKL